MHAGNAKVNVSRTVPVLANHTSIPDIWLCLGTNFILNVKSRNIKGARAL